MRLVEEIPSYNKFDQHDENNKEMIHCSNSLLKDNDLSADEIQFLKSYNTFIESK